MSRRALTLALAVVAALAAMAASVTSAGAAVTVGTGCVASAPVVLDATFSAADDPGDPNLHAIPSNGVVTSWSVRDSYSELVATQQLKVFRKVGPGEVAVVGESAFAQLALGTNTLPTRIPVQAGDLLGLGGQLVGQGHSYVGSLICREMGPGDILGAVSGNPPVGTTSPLVLEETEFASPATVTVEPDADGDGYGDETQDECPTDASTHGPCPTAPAPPAPIALNASAVAQRRSATITVSASAAADVSVAGKVRVGKRELKLSAGHAQPVAAGALVRFRVFYPPRMVNWLRREAPGIRLALHLTASAPGATAAQTTLKVRGQKPGPAEHHLM